MKSGCRALRGVGICALVACGKGTGGAADASSATPAPPASTATPTPTSTTTSSTAPAAASTAPAPPPYDAGPTSCRVLFGPKELPVRSPVALSTHPDAIEAILDEDGRPRIVEEAAGPFSTRTTGDREPLEGGAAAGLSVGCAVAGEQVFCPDRAGNVHRTARGGGGDRLVASARVGSRVAAAQFEGGNVAFAYLASRQTSEGWVTEAWMGIDDAPPVRISEDGSGATAIVLAPRGAGLLALSVDARTALTAMHARPITYDHGLRLGEDAVVFVGGPGDRRTAPGLAVGRTGAGLGLLPIAKDVRDFGLALVRVDDPPRVDEPVAWSVYPNGLDPAPVAAAMGKHADGVPVAWVARARPWTAEPASARLLEVGVVAGGTLDFAPRYVVPGTGATIKDVSLAVDARGALWVAWLDDTGSWLERLACK